MVNNDWERTRSYDVTLILDIRIIDPLLASMATRVSVMQSLGASSRGGSGDVPASTLNRPSHPTTQFGAGDSRTSQAPGPDGSTTPALAASHL
jgi:hypothetical protein